MYATSLPMVYIFLRDSIVGKSYAMALSSWKRSSSCWLATLWCTSFSSDSNERKNPPMK